MVPTQGALLILNHLLEKVNYETERICNAFELIGSTFLLDMQARIADSSSNSISYYLCGFSGLSVLSGLLVSKANEIHHFGV